MAFDLDRTDTICAPATALGPAAIAVVRVSGRSAEAVRDRVFRPRRGSCRPFRVTLGEVLHSDRLVDEAMCTFFPEGRSYTGEASFELSVHGGISRVQATLAALVDAGCRLAEPGEFTLRAVLTGRLDLTAAEGVVDVIEARTDAAARAALQQVSGELGRAGDALAQALIEVLAELESRLDYPDDDLGDASREQLVERLSVALEQLDRLLSGAAMGRRLTEGARVVLYGRPNAGKSTLLNALLGEDRAIVHATPGTTRDVLEAEADLGGYPCVLVDVAGVRDGEEVGEIEALGIARARAELAKADLVLRLTAVDDERPAVSLASSVPTIEVVTKVDLATSPSRRLAVSASTGAGLEALLETIVTALGGAPTSDEVLPTRARQVRQMQACREAVSRAHQALAAGHPDEVVCGELRVATRALDHLLGRDLNEEVLDEVFSRFCIGK